MSLFDIASARRRIFNAIDAVQRLDYARPLPAFHKSRMGQRFAECQQHQREQVEHTFDKLVESHRLLEQTQAELEGAQRANKKLHDELAATRESLHKLVYVTPSSVLIQAGLVEYVGRRGAAFAAAQRPPEAVKYTGHGSNTGGLQQHSIGPEYPFITYMHGDKWRVLDSRTGHTHYAEWSRSDHAHNVARSWAQGVANGQNIAIQSNGFFGIHKEE
ncbi:hypothetical protein [Burkholderia sp. BDU5]|uniref:hypothetical protein n=1 Tax=Burkholderia sp. BDU5 TaxID=1385590 RepID=UPI00075291CC|nr:hypothetical protein [Burkholderia sp. BDU5]KVE35705.1 hypothetical protein WS69_13725 [Burkholderia sp. BDU5]